MNSKLMDLKQHYNKLWNQSLKKFRKRKFQLDPLIDSPKDTRYGLTLLARPSTAVKQCIIQTLAEIQSVAPNQYYYPASDLHITVLSIISCYAGFSLDDINPEAYRLLIDKALQNVSPFEIQFSGLTASPSCILIQGFPDDNQLNSMRNNLRGRFNQSNLQHSIDKRYLLKTAHITAMRLKEPLVNPDTFTSKITDLRNRNFGSCKIDQLELVANDWYQQHDKVQHLNTFTLDTTANHEYKSPNS